MKKKYSLVLIAFLCLTATGFGQTTVTYDFSDSGAVTGLNETAPGIALDTNIGFGSFRNGGTANPALNSGQLRLYQNNTKGGSIIIYANNGVTISDVVIYASGTTGPAGYNVDGTFVSNLSSSTTYTMSGLSASSSVEFFQRDGSSNNRIYVDRFTVTYSSVPSGPTITATPTTITGLDYSFGNGPSAPQSFDIEGTLLTAGIDITAPTNFEIATSVAGSYNSTVNISALDANNTNTIYVRLVSGLVQASYSGTITMTNATSGLSSTPTVDVGGEVTAPPPSNNDCSGAISLTPTASCTYVTYTNENATDSGELAPGCASYNGEDVWFSVIVPASGEITIDTNNIDFTDSGMALYSGTCGSLTLIECDDDDSPNGAMSSITRDDLTPGATVYIRVWEFNGGTTGDFGICVTTPTPCTAPTSQPTNLTFNNITGSSIDGSFSTTTADEYLVVVSTSSTLGANPVDGVTYNNGDTIGSGTVVQSSNATTFTATGLSQTTQYYFFVFAYNDSSCAGGPAYNTITPLTDDETTITGPCLEEDFSGWGHGYSNWTETTADGTWTANDSYAGSNRIQLNDVGDWLELPPISNAQTFEYETALSSSSSGTQDGMIVQYFDGSSWIDIQQDYFTSTSYSTVTVTLPFPVSNGTNVRLRLYRSDHYRVQYINNIRVFCGLPCTPPADPVGTISSIDAPDFCETAELAFSGTAPTDIVYYWQTSPTDIDTTYDAANALDVTTDGDFYVRAYNTVTSCWSDDVVGPYTVTISNLPEITDQPDNINVANGDNATFSVTATNTVSYQWQVSTDGGSSWSNTGTDSPTLNVLGVNLSMLGNIYRVIVSNSCGDTLSDEAILFVYSGSPCIEEDFNSFPDAGWTNNGTINETTAVHSGASQPCRVFGTGDNIITSQTDYPTILEFYQDASSGGDGNIATVDYRIGTGSWMPLYSFSASEVGKTELVDLTDVSGVNLGSQANVRFRFNSSFNTWYLDDVKVYCTPCTPPTITTTIDLSSGPVGTYVTISGSQLGTATVSFNSIALTPISQNANEIVVQVPANAVDGSFIIETNTIVCDTAFPFDVIDEELNCQSNITPAPTDLFIYELFDEDQNIDGSGGAWGNGGMITVYNGTLETKDLSDYRLYRTTDYTNTGSNPYSLWHSLSGTLAPGEVYRIWIDGSNCTDYATPYETEYIGFNASDGVELRKNNGSGNYITIDQLHTANIVGYHYVRDLTAIDKPDATYDASDWAFTDIYPSSPYCVGAGQAPDFEGGTPTISLDTPITSCDTYEITANAIEGYTGAFSPPADSYNLTFQWYYFDGVTDMWNPISTGGDYTVVDTSSQSTLTIDNITDKSDYQFYCEVSEGAGCYTASDAFRPLTDYAIWDGTNWSSAPASNKTAILNADYNTSVNVNGETSFEACNLIINDAELIIADANNGGVNTYVEVGNDLILNGTASILVHPQGAFVQINDDGLVTADNPDNIQVNKRTAMMDNWYEYTYWSSPVFEETIGDALVDASSNRRFKFSAQDYRDSNQEINNTNTFIIGQDNIDDPSSFADGTGYDWQQTNNSDFMTPGVGYASTHDSGLFSALPCNNGPNCQFTYSFRGLFNNGVFEVWMYRNDEETNDNNWNLLGNPYPSAISADAFLNYNADIGTATNRVVDGAIYLWSQNTPPDGNTSGNEQLNFSQSDYAIINGVGETATSAGGDGSDPTNRMIPSGQAFFIAMSDTAPTTEYVSNPTAQVGDIQRKRVVFNNSMRVRATNDNSQFFRQNTTNTPNKLWLDLTSDNGVFNQILVGYVDNATNGLDKMYFDAPMASPNVNAVMYSIIEGSNKKYTIQGKAPESLTLNEVIPLGFSTLINTPTIYTLTISKLEGEFLTTNTIYVKDKLLNITHNLSETDYTFTSEAGEFNERFEIVFMPEALSIDDKNISPKDLTIIELNDNDVKFTIGANITIEHVEIIDLLGRTLYNFNGNSNSEIYNLSALSQATYLAKVTLSNGQVITKKAVKRK